MRDISSRTAGTVRMRCRRGQQDRPRDDQRDDHHAAELSRAKKQHRDGYDRRAGDGGQELDGRGEETVDAMRRADRYTDKPSDERPRTQSEYVCRKRLRDSGCQRPRRVQRGRALSTIRSVAERTTSHCSRRVARRPARRPRVAIRAVVDAGCATALWTDTDSPFRVAGLPGRPRADGAAQQALSTYPITPHDERIRPHACRCKCIERFDQAAAQGRADT